MASVKTLALLTAATALQWSCREAAQTADTVIRDSARVLVAEARLPLWRNGSAWSVGPEPLLDLGAVEGPDEYLFSDVVGAVRLAHGSIVVADRESSDLRWFDSGGRFVRRIGGEGEGPGEFRSLAFVGRMWGDSVVAFDDALRRIQIFGPEGGVVRSLTVESPDPAVVPDRVIGLVNGQLLAIRMLDFRGDVPQGVVRWPPERITTVDLASGSVHGWRTVTGSEADVERRPGGGYRHGRVMFARGNEFAAGAGRLAIIDTGFFSIELLGSDGTPASIIRRSVAAKPTTPGDVDRYLAENLDLVFPEGSDPDPDDVARFRQMILALPKAPSLPLLRSVHLDAGGSIWVEPYFNPGAEPPPFQVFSPGGIWLGSVALPEGLERGFVPFLAPALEIGTDYVLGVWKDALDVQHVRLYPLHRS